VCLSEGDGDGGECGRVWGVFDTRMGGVSGQAGLSTSEAGVFGVFFSTYFPVVYTIACVMPFFSTELQK
jgi:hypothetical protein